MRKAKYLDGSWRRHSGIICTASQFMFNCWYHPFRSESGDNCLVACRGGGSVQSTDIKKNTTDRPFSRLMKSFDRVCLFYTTKWALNSATLCGLEKLITNCSKINWFQKQEISDIASKYSLEAEGKRDESACRAIRKHVTVEKVLYQANLTADLKAVDFLGLQKMIIKNCVVQKS